MVSSLIKIKKSSPGWNPGKVNGVYRLEGMQYHVIVSPVVADVAATGRSLLVGHAFTGAVLAAAKSDTVRALVYVAARAPDERETVADVFYYRAEPHPSAPGSAPSSNRRCRLD
jgi:hypothetical protein